MECWHLLGAGWWGTVKQSANLPKELSFSGILCLQKACGTCEHARKLFSKSFPKEKVFSYRKKCLEHTPATLACTMLKVNTPNRSLGISLWKMGYDVWLTNSRGNTFSRNHTELKPFLDKQFWNYTFDDMGYFDVVANVRYILNATSRKDLTFVGWSQGTSQMFVAAQGPDRDYLKSHVNLFVALSPVTYLTHQSSLLLSVAQKFRLGVILEKAFPYDVFSWSELPTLGSLLCKAGGPRQQAEQDEVPPSDGKQGQKWVVRVLNSSRSRAFPLMGEVSEVSKVQFTCKPLRLWAQKR